MSEFLAIMKESLWSTMASRLLYVELIGVVVLLLALFPFGYQERVAFSVNGSEITRPETLAKQWVESSTQVKPNAAKLFWEQLSKEDQETVSRLATSQTATQAGRGPGRRRSSGGNQLADVMETLVSDSSVWADDYWTGNIDGQEAKQLWQRKDSLEPEYQKRLNRLLLQEAFRGQIRAPRDTNATLVYAGNTLLSIPMSRLGLEEVIRNWTPFLLDKVFLTVGLLLAVLVTASLIPQMLEEGSLYLLLSKPVSRVFLLLTKYIGSGLLIFIISAMFLTGIWFILGVRFQIWMNEILWCIPLYVAIYLIYFSLTVATGLVFRNAIISIIVTILFALTCYSLSTSRYAYSGLVAFDRTAEVQAVADRVLRKTTIGQTKILDGDNQWRIGFFEFDAKSMPVEAFEMTQTMSVFPRYAKPIFLPSLSLLVGGVPKAPNNMAPSTTMGVARVDNDQEMISPKTIGQLPAGCIGFILEAPEQLLAVSSYGNVYRLSGPGFQILQDASKGAFPSQSTALAKVADFQSDETQEESPKSVRTTTDAGEETLPTDEKEAAALESDSDAAADQPGPDSPNLWLPAGNLSMDGPESMKRLAYDSKTGNFYIMGRSTLSRAVRSDDGTYQPDLTFSIPWEWTFSNRTPIVALDGHVLVPLRAGSLIVFDGETLKPVSEFDMKNQGVPLAATVSPNGKVAALSYSSGSLWLFDADSQELKQRTLLSEIPTALDFNDENQLVIAHGVDNVTTFDTETGTRVDSIRPSTGWLRRIFDWGVEPVYFLFPKPNECYVLIEHLANNGKVDAGRNEQANGGGPDISVETMQIQTDSPWQPLLSSIAFASVIMIFNCIYFARQEF